MFFYLSKLIFIVYSYKSKSLKSIEVFSVSIGFSFGFMLSEGSEYSLGLKNSESTECITIAVRPPANPLL